MCPVLTPASKPILDLPTSEGWKAELTQVTRQNTLARNQTHDFLITSLDALTITPLNHPETDLAGMNFNGFVKKTKTDAPLCVQLLKIFPVKVDITCRYIAVPFPQKILLNFQENL